MHGYCPECDSRVNVGDKPHEGQKVTCQNCMAQLHIIGLSPVELDWLFYEEDEGYWEEEAEYEG